MRELVIMSNTVAIVLGSTGLVGSALVHQLATCEDYSHVLALSRRPISSPFPKVTNHVLDFDNLEASLSLLKGDVLFSCLGTTRKKAGSIDAQKRVDVDYQFKVAELAAQNGVKHYSLVSSSGADVRSTNPYLKMKGELEDKVSQLNFERMSIFQPSLLLGSRPEIRFAEMMGALALPAICKLPGLGKYKPISGHQVAKKMIEISLRSGPAKEYFRLDQIF